VSRPRIAHPLIEAFLRVCDAAATPTLDDYCDGNIGGAFANYLT